MFLFFYDSDNLYTISDWVRSHFDSYLVLWYNEVGGKPTCAGWTVSKLDSSQLLDGEMLSFMT